MNRLQSSAAAALVIATGLGGAGCSQYSAQELPESELPEIELPDSATYGKSSSHVAAKTVEIPPIVSDRFLLERPDQAIVGQRQTLILNDRDTFVDVARHYGLGFDELVQANPGVDPWLPGGGTVIGLPTQFVLPDAPREGIVLNVATKRLFYYPVPGEEEPPAVATFPVGIGRYDWATPLGSTGVVSKARNPTWFVPASIRREAEADGEPLPAQVPPGPDNPLGQFVLTLGMPGYLLHGTNKPAGVGMRVSHGCVRLFPNDMEFLFGDVDIGTAVTIVNQPYLVTWTGGQLYVEAHPPLVEDDTNWSVEVARMIEETLAAEGESVSIVDRGKLRSAIAEHRGIPIPVLAGHRSSDDPNLEAPLVVNVITFDHLREPLISQTD